jgi:propanediol dehydratase large subunit
MNTNISMLIKTPNIIQSTCDITNFKGPSKKYVISKVRYIEIHYIKSINQQNLFKRYLKENLDFIRVL